MVSTSGHTNSGFTNDHAKLGDAIVNLQRRALYEPTKHDCPEVGYYQADLIQNKNDLGALQTAIQDAIDCGVAPETAKGMAISAARRTLMLGDQWTRVTLAFIREVVQRMANLPGQHLVILVSPGFPADTAGAIYDKTHLVDVAAQANVTISALDARGLYTAAMDASENGGSPSQVRMKSQYHEQSMMADQDVMAELADGTGGTYFHNSNDLEGGLKRLTRSPEYLYLLEFSPQNVKQDGTYHRITVVVDSADVRVHARHGYFSPKHVKGEK